LKRSIPKDAALKNLCETFFLFGLWSWHRLNGSDVEAKGVVDSKF